jgi:hypothetical protein
MSLCKIEGFGAVLELLNEEITITGKGIMGGVRGTKAIPIGSIVAIRHERPGYFFGHMRFTVLTESGREESTFAYCRRQDIDAAENIHSYILERLREVDGAAIESQSGERTERVGRALWLGIFFLPYIFAWFTLQGRYSTRARIFAFGWLALYFVLNVAQKETKHATSAAQAPQASIAANHLSSQSDEPTGSRVEEQSNESFGSMTGGTWLAHDPAQRLADATELVLNFGDTRRRISERGGQVYVTPFAMVMMACISKSAETEYGRVSSVASIAALCGLVTDWDDIGGPH